MNIWILFRGVLESSCVLVTYYFSKSKWKHELLFSPNSVEMMHCLLWLFLRVVCSSYL